jgi:hypothetical protein
MAKEEEEEMTQNVERITQMNESSTSQNDTGSILRIWQNFKAQIK